MFLYSLKHFFDSVLIIIGVITVSFVLIYLVPADPVKIILGQRADEGSINAVREELGLNKPVYVQYYKYLSRAITGDLGKSYITNRGVTNTILEKLPATALLSFCALIIASVFGILFGVISSIKPNSVSDYLSMIVALFGISIPQFVLGLIAVLVFGSVLKWLPVSGYITGGFEYLILPVVVLAFRPLAIIARMTRSSMLEVMNQDYVKTAKAKGAGKYRILIKHCLRNALNPVVTTISASLAATLGGAFFIEYIFNWPGIGLLAVDSIMKLDYPMIQGTVLFSAVVFVVINFFVDIIYAVLDPRVKIS